ncbi:MAG: ABC transporter substrate-binding protein [Tabrizicola sp.]|nr:ABC transporter substrate-binding protein [Tabrizicola sp.]
MKTIKMVACSTLALVTGLGPVLAQVTEIGAPEGQVNIVAWPGYIERGETMKEFDWVTKFEAATGCKVNVKTANTSDEMVALMNEGGFDLVTASGDASLRLVAGDRVQPINIDLIPSWSTVDDRLKSAPWHTVDGVHYGVPYMWGPNVLMYNTEVFKEPPTSWNVVFEEMTLPDGQSNKGRVQAYDGPIHIADAAQYLMFHKPELGITSPYELNEDQYKAALDLLRQQRTLVSRYWHDAFIQIDDFKNEGVVASGSWPFQRNLLQSDNQPIASVIPQEGATGWADTTMLQLPVDGAHPVLEPAGRPGGLVRGEPGGSGRLHRWPRHVDGRDLHRERDGRFREDPVLDHPGVELLARRRRLRALLPLGLGLHRRDRRALIP